MKANVGGLDRGLRFILGVLLLGLFFLDGNVKYFGILGIVFIATAALRFCPFYPLLKVSTLKK